MCEHFFVLESVHNFISYADLKVCAFEATYIYVVLFMESQHLH